MRRRDIFPKVLTYSIAGAPRGEISRIFCPAPMLRIEKPLERKFGKRTMVGVLRRIAERHYVRSPKTALDAIRLAAIIEGHIPAANVLISPKTRIWTKEELLQAARESMPTDDIIGVGLATKDELK